MSFLFNCDDFWLGKDEENIEAIKMLAENEELYENVVESFDEEIIVGSFEIEMPTAKAETKAEKKAAKKVKKQTKKEKKTP